MSSKEFPLWRSGMGGLSAGPDSICHPAQWVKGSYVATGAALIQSLARELPYAMNVAI